jgi:hypothetical protein
MKGQDIVILSALLTTGFETSGMHALAKTTGISLSETHAALKRLAASGLIDKAKRLPIKPRALEFFCHGLAYVFPAEPGPMTRGLATAHAAKPLKALFGDTTQAWVWPWELGQTRGESIKPLYRTVPVACAHNPALFEWLALLDALRAGLPRVRQASLSEIQQRLAGRA